MPKQSEKQLAEKVIAWLEEDGWDVYQEVQGGTGLAVADIVAIKGPVYWVIEVKTALNLTVLAQAVRWAAYSHMKAVAVPNSRDSVAKRFGEVVAREYGVGILKVGNYGVQYRPGGFESKPRQLKRLKKSIKPEHKTYAKAGTAGGSHWTEYKGTVMEVKKYLRNKPGASMAEVITAIDHHYSNDRSAKACLSRYIEEGIIKGIRKEKVGRKIHLFLEEGSDG
jgi:hypothetical protein